METTPGKKLPETDNVTGLRVADMLMMPDEVQALLSWAMRNRGFTLDQAAAKLNRDPNEVRTVLNDLMSQRLIRRTEEEGVARYTVRMAHSSHRQMPKDIWKVLDQETNAANVFISYSRRNKEFVKTLAQTLKKRGREVWVDWESIPLGSDWWEEIQVGIEVADTFIFVLSPDSVSSRVCGEELDHAIQHNKRLVPVVCEDVNPNDVHSELAKINWIFLRPDDDFDRGFRNLVNVLDADLPYVRAHTRLLVRANQWKNAGRDESLLIRGSELEDARRWLSQSDKKHPPCLQLQKEFIWASNNAELGRQYDELERKKSVEKLQRAVMVLVAIAAVLGISFGIGSFALYRRAEASRKVAEANRQQAEALEAVAQDQRLGALTDASTALYGSEQYFDALLSAVEAGVEFQSSSSADPMLRSRVITALQQSLLGIQERNRLDAHKGSVWDATFSPDGTWLASASADTTVCIWERNGHPRMAVGVPEVEILSVAIAPDSEHLATAGDDGRIYLWDQEGNQTAVLEGHTGAVRQVAFSPDGNYLASGSTDNTVRLWRRDGTLVRTLTGHRDVVNDVQFSPDGRQIAAASSDGSARVWLLDGVPFRNLPHDIPLNTIRFSHDGRHLLTGGNDGRLRVWTQRGNLWRTIDAHNTPIFSIAVSPDDTQLATAGWDKTIRIWKRDGTLVRTLPAHQSRIYQLEFSPDGTTLLSAGGDRSVRLWQVQPSLFTFLPSHEASINEAQFSPNGERLITASNDDTLKLWRRDGTLIRSIDTHTAPVSGVAFSPNGEFIVSAGFDRQIVRYTPNGAVVWAVGTGAPVHAVSISPDSQRIATAHADGTIHLWDPDGNVLQVLDGHIKDVLDVTFSPDGMLLASASADKTAILWTAGGERQQTLSGHHGAVNSVRFSQNGERIATGGADTNVILWTPSGEALATLAGHQDGVSTVAFTPDGQYLATGSLDGTFHIWESLDGTPITRLRSPSGRIRTLHFSPDGNNLVMAGSDANALILNIERFNDLDHLLTLGCDWLSDYLANNLDLDEEKRSLCAAHPTTADASVPAS
ncbi:MAG: TIR domain-containing protein [Cyanobacteria bacterium J06638_22]